MEKDRSSRSAGCAYAWMVISVSNWVLMDSPCVQHVCAGPQKPHPSAALLVTVPALPTGILHQELLKGLLNSKTGYAVCAPLVWKMPRWFHLGAQFVHFGQMHVGSHCPSFPSFGVGVSWALARVSCSLSIGHMALMVSANLGKK